jgi:hypothetical protein
MTKASARAIEVRMNFLLTNAAVARLAAARLERVVTEMPVSYTIDALVADEAGAGDPLLMRARARRCDPCCAIAIENGDVAE